MPSQIRTPLLIQHSERDLRTPIGQAEELFTVLRSLRRPVRMMRVPDESHELTRSGTPFRRVENAVQIRNWFEHFLVAAGAACRRCRATGPACRPWVASVTTVQPAAAAAPARRRPSSIRSFDAPGRLAGQPPRPGDAGRPGRRRGAGRLAQAALDQDGLEAVGPRPGDPDDGSDHPRGEGHAGQDPGPVRQGDPAAAGRSDDPARGRDLRLSGPRRRCQGGPRFVRRPRRQRRDRLSVGPDVPRPEAGRDAPGDRGRRRRDRHGHRSGRLPGRRLRRRLRRDRGGQGGLRRDPPQGDPRDGRARDLRQRPPGERPGDGRRGRLHQDLDRQGDARPPPCR